MNILWIVLALAGGLALGILMLLAVVRLLAAQARSTQEDAVSAALNAALVERGATADVLERDREATVHAAVTRAAEVADAKLDARLRQGTEQLDARMRLGTEQLANGSIAFQKTTEDMALEMRRMQKMIADLQEKSAGQHGAVVSQLAEAAKVTGQLQLTAGGLREALASSKARGQWGERMAEDVLQAAGFVEGVNYRTQKGIESGGRPDITFLMPKQMVLHMDVKFPIDNYVRFLEESEAGGQMADEFRKRFVNDAKTRVKELADRRYHEASDSVDSVVLFIPNESVFVFVQESAPGLLDEALGSKIVLCGPSTLFAVLAVVRQAMDNFMLERRSDEIMDCLSQFKAEWEKFSGEVDRHGKHLATAQRSFEALSGARTNQMQRRLTRIDELQASREPGEMSGGIEIDEIGEVNEIGESDVVDDGPEWPPLRPVVSA